MSRHLTDFLQGTDRGLVVWLPAFNASRPECGAVAPLVAPKSLQFCCCENTSACVGFDCFIENAVSGSGYLCLYCRICGPCGTATDCL